MIITLHNDFHGTETKIKIDECEYNELLARGISPRAAEMEIWCSLEARENDDQTIRAKLNRWRNKLCPSRAGGCRCGGLYHN